MSSSPSKQASSTPTAVNNNTTTTTTSASSDGGVEKKVESTPSIFTGFGVAAGTFPATTASSMSTSSVFAPATFGGGPATFGGPALFGGGGAAAAASKGGENEEEDGEEGGEGGATDADEAHAQDFKPVVQLTEVKVKSMEEDEDVLLKLRAKLFVFVKEDVYGGEVRQNYWKERGIGDVKILKHKTTGYTRVVMRQDKTLKICLNHLVSPSVDLRPNVGSDKSWVFVAQDFADGQNLKTETFAIKFGKTETAETYKEAIEAAKKSNAAKMAENAPENELVGAVSSKLAIDKDSKPHSVVGGYSEKSVEDEEVIAAGKFATEKIGMGEFVKVTAAQAQVVAGMNYKITIHIKYTIDSAIHAHSVLVHKPLPHTNEPMQLKENSHLGLLPQS